MMPTAVYTLILLLIVPCSCFNHWVVTEEGKIEYQVASPFNLRQPFDLMAFIQQEERVSLLKDLKEELIEYKNEFESYSGFETFDESFRAKDYDCKNVKLISSYDLYITTLLPLEHKGIRLTEHLDLTSNPNPAEPYCNTTPLHFSMYALEHLEGVQARRSLVAPPEKSVLWSIDVRVEVFGSLVRHALEKNSSSWVLLDLATLYWRARGNPYHAVECIRRALHHSPERSMDIALLNLANVLHRSHHSEDALVPLQVAVTLAPDVNVLHYTLGNIYAALNQLNESVRSFKRSYDLEPDGETASTMYKAALCELKMEQASQERSNKLDLTQKKLDQFYEYMDIVRQQQVVSVGEEEAIIIRPKKKPKKRNNQPSQIKAMDATPVHDPEASQPFTPHTLTHHDDSETERKIKADERKSERETQDRDNLELALDDAVLNASSHLTPEIEPLLNDSQPFNESETVSSLSSNHSNDVDDVIDRRLKPRRSKLRLVLKPLTPEDEECEKDFVKCPRCVMNNTTEENRTEETNSCPNKHSIFVFSSLFLNTCAVDSKHLGQKSKNSNFPSFEAKQQSSVLKMSEGSQNETTHGSDKTDSEEIKKAYSDLNEALNCVLGEGSDERCEKTNHEYHTKLQQRQVEKLSEKVNNEIERIDTKHNRKVRHKGTENKRSAFDEMSVFEHFDSEEWQGPKITVDAQGRKMGEATLPDNSKPLYNREYPDSYHKMNFLPYNPLPEQLEAIIFPKTVSPLVTFDDPYWPGKQECLQLVQKLRVNPKFASFTGTFIIPEARGADIDKLFISVPWVLPANMQSEPRCTDIVDLPYSMSAMDHLEPIMYRNNLRVNQQTGERVIQKRTLYHSKEYPLSKLSPILQRHMLKMH